MYSFQLQHALLIFSHYQVINNITQHHWVSEWHVTKYTFFILNEFKWEYFIASSDIFEIRMDSSSRGTLLNNKFYFRGLMHTTKAAAHNNNFFLMCREQYSIVKQTGCLMWTRKPKGYYVPQSNNWWIVLTSTGYFELQRLRLK